MTTAEMETLLALRLEDADQIRFTAASGIKIKELNNAQVNLALMLNEKYLTELEEVKDNVAVASGVTAALDSALLGSTILGGTSGIKGVKGRTGVTTWIKPKIIDDIIETEEAYSFGTADDPIYWVFKNIMRVLPVAATAIDIYFLKEPTVMVNGGQAPTLNVALHEMIVTLAEGYCWNQDKEPGRADAALQRVYDMVKLLNSKYEVIA